MQHAISWFEIPSINLERATKFYETIFAVQLIVMDTPNIKMRLFPLEDMSGIGGAVVDSGGFRKPRFTKRFRQSRSCWRKNYGT
jgi:predicted enzyme related to lactoylglutathione lyase